MPQQVPQALRGYVRRSTPSGRGQQAPQAPRDQERRTARGMPSGGASSKRLRRSAGGQSVLAASASRSVPSAYLRAGHHVGALGVLATNRLQSGQAPRKLPTQEQQGSSACKQQGRACCNLLARRLYTFQADERHSSGLACLHVLRCWLSPFYGARRPPPGFLASGCRRGCQMATCRRCLRCAILLPVCKKQASTAVAAAPPALCKHFCVRCTAVVLNKLADHLLVQGSGNTMRVWCLHLSHMPICAAWHKSSPLSAVLKTRSTALIPAIQLLVTGTCVSAANGPMQRRDAHHGLGPS